MNFLKSTFLVFALALVCVQAEKFRFDNYRLLRITPRTNEQVALLGRLEENVDFDVWTMIKGPNAHVDVLLSPEAFEKYSLTLKNANISFEVVNENIQDAFDEQDRSMAVTKNSRQVVGKYVDYSKIMSYIDDITAHNPQFASSYDAGRTAENRRLKVLVLKTSTSKRSVWIDCGIHAREWVSPASCIWTIQTLVDGYNNNDPEIMSLLNYFEFHIMPVLNPDGYEYSFYSYRMWRKNRSGSGSGWCIGTDLNRNFGYKWMTGGSSSNPCSDTYAGPRADSELETKAVQKAITDKQGDWDAYITIHSYGLWWFTPWGYTQSTSTMTNFNDLMTKANIGAKAFQNVNGMKLVVGPSSQILYIASGGSEDWAYGTAGIKYAYCLELRPGQTGPDSGAGFALPESRVPDAGKETYAGIAAFLKSIIV